MHGSTLLAYGRPSGNYYLINIVDFAQFDRIYRSPWGHLLLAIVNDKPDYRGRSLVLSFACRPMHIVAIYLLRRGEDRYREVSRTGLDWPVGMPHRRL
jgi:hypothetical protein